MFPSTDMERASKLIRGLTLPADAFNAEDLARAAWPQAVGKTIAGHTRPMRMVRTRLIVEVEDKTWQRQLFVLTTHILRNLEKNLGPGVVGDIEFRIVPRRRGPQLAEQSVSTPKDEAETISDPVLRGIYKASRKKALA
jgi:hypothetical protein